MLETTAKLVILYLALCNSNCHFGCKPFGLRIFYGEILTDPTSQHSLTIYFNTADQCTKSYLQIVGQAFVHRENCTLTTLLIKDKKNSSYTANIHKCRIRNRFFFEQPFFYNAFGWAEGTTDKPEPFSDAYIKTKIADPRIKTRDMRVIMLADWSKIDKLNYTPVTESIRQVVEGQEIDVLVVVGDIAYDLDSNNCLNYEEYLDMLARCASTKVPIIQVTGNHEYNSPNTIALFRNSFELYSLDSNLATGLFLGSVFLMPFDPYQALYAKASNPVQRSLTRIAEVDEARDPCLPAFLDLFAKARESGRFIVPCSHYPFACSGDEKACSTTRVILKAYFDAMFDNKVSLYVGAHIHTYQRSYPYYPNGTFTKIDGEYTDDAGYLLSIVEGVAGNDAKIVEEIPQIEAFTASYTINETGFGVLNSFKNSVQYTHFSTKNSLHITDSMTILKINDKVSEQ